MDVVCELCGVVGFKHLLVQCNNCKNSIRHRYCLDTIIYDGPSIEWLCDDCVPKHSEAAESLEFRCDDHHSIQLGSSIINGPNVNRVELTKELWSWGHHRYRSHKARRDSTDACTSGDTLNSSEMFAGENLNRNDVEKEGESKADHLIYMPESADGSSHSASDPASEIKLCINSLKTKGGFEPTMERLDLSKEKDSCFSSSKYVQGSIPQGTKADLLTSINDVERSHPFVTDDSCPRLPSVEQADGSSHTLENVEQSRPLEVVKPDGSSHSAVDPTLNSMELLDLATEQDSCFSSMKYVEGSIPQGTKTDLFPSINDVEQSYPFVTVDYSPSLPTEEQVDGCSPTMESWEQPHPLEVVKRLVHTPKSILGSNSSSNYSQPMQRSDQNIGNMDVLDPSKECLDSRPMSKTIELASSTNGQGDSTVDKDNAERTKCLSDEEIVTPELDNLKGPSPSMAKECLILNVDNSDEANRPDKHFLCTVDNKERGQSTVPSYQNTSSGKLHSSCNGLNEGGNLCKANESSDPKPALKGNRCGRNLQNDVRRTSVRAGKNVVCRQVSQMEGVNCEALPIKHVGQCKATKSSSKKKHNRPNRHIPRHTKHQKTKLIKNINADPAKLKSGRLPKQPDHTHSSASLELSSKTKEVHDANDAEPRCSSAAQTFENVMPKKRKLILPYSEDEDAEATQVEDSNPRSSDNYGQVKKRRRCVENGVMNQRRSVENCEESLRPGNSNHQYVKNHTQEKTQRSIEANEDKNPLLGDPTARCAQSDAAQLASQAVVAEDHCSLSAMPVIYTQPTDKPYWTGIMKIGQEYISLAAHLSDRSCKKVQELSRSLPPVMKVTMHSKLKAWPKRWEASEPTADSIGLYFLSDNMRPNKELDRLVQYVTDHSIVLKYVVGFAKLLIFPSVLLPEQCQMFQGKHYLWGVFKRRMGMSKAGNPVKQKDCTLHISKKKEEQQNKGAR
ncbi:ASI1-immunoprecipitated protein 2-like [Phragmites australis]|uniref:ASI1-immunoprecipitated protein 2-like n=1 Tax=Phragmites australis TaxID=29695 RepID=UPI002D77FBCC|nr:ASI1-immunoprecipitated protein 2-like [Phragmites australis]